MKGSSIGVLRLKAFNEILPLDVDIVNLRSVVQWLPVWTMILKRPWARNESMYTFVCNVYQSSAAVLRPFIVCVPDYAVEWNRLVLDTARYLSFNDRFPSASSIVRAHSTLLSLIIIDNELPYGWALGTCTGACCSIAANARPLSWDCNVLNAHRSQAPTRKADYCYYQHNYRASNSVYGVKHVRVCLGILQICRRDIQPAFIRYE